MGQGKALTPAGIFIFRKRLALLSPNPESPNPAQGKQNGNPTCLLFDRNEMSLRRFGHQQPQPSVVIDAAGYPGGLCSHPGIEVNMAGAFNGAPDILGDEETVFMADHTVLAVVINRKGGQKATAEWDVFSVNGNGIAGQERNAACPFGGR